MEINQILPHMWQNLVDKECSRSAAKGNMRTLNAILADAVQTGDLLEADRHMSRTSQRWMSDPGDLFYMTGGSRLNQWWVKCKALRQADGRVAAFMAQLMLDEYMGRGLPRLTDHELAQTARERFPVAPRADLRDLPHSHKTVSLPSTDQDSSSEASLPSRTSSDGLVKFVSVRLIYR